MALYWPQRALALDIVDDPCSAPVDREAFPGLTVVELTRDQLAHPARRSARFAAARGAGTVRHGGQDGGAGPARWDG